MDARHLLEVGRITGVHGIRGNVKTQLYAGEESVCLDLESITVRLPDGRQAAYGVVWIKPHTRSYLMSLEGVVDRAGAQALVGGIIVVDRRSLPQLDDDSYYWFELEGMAVNTMDGTPIGTITSIMETGSNDVYVVRAGKQETLIPALKSVIKRVDRQRRIMTVDLPEGL
jgi:16S rRNA processing protein RimM